MINVNYGRLQGDANLIVTNDINIMIDAGAYQEAEKMVVPYLAKQGIKKIHHFFISHAHFDHFEGLEAIQNHGVVVENVYFNLPEEGIKDCCYDRQRFLKYIKAAEKRGAKLHQPDIGFELSLDDDSFLKILYKHDKKSFKGKSIDVNDTSIIMMWNINGWRTLFTGDLNKTIGGFLANNDQMQADILKVPHHGLVGIAPLSFFVKVNPKLNMIPGQARRYLTKKMDIVRNFSQDNNIPHCLNGFNGTVVLKYKNNRVYLDPEIENEWCSKGLVIQK